MSEGDPPTVRAESRGCSCDRACLSEHGGVLIDVPDRQVKVPENWSSSGIGHPGWKANTKISRSPRATRRVTSWSSTTRRTTILPDTASRSCERRHAGIASTRAFRQAGGSIGRSAAHRGTPNWHHLIADAIEPIRRQLELVRDPSGAVEGRQALKPLTGLSAVVALRWPVPSVIPRELLPSGDPARERRAPPRSRRLPGSRLRRWPCRSSPQPNDCDDTSATLVPDRRSAAPESACLPEICVSRRRAPGRSRSVCPALSEDT